MIAATLGAKNRPPPIPVITIGIARIGYGTLYGSIANKKSAIAVRTRPVDANTRGPNRSERAPLRGPTMTNATENGSRRMPAVNAS